VGYDLNAVKDGAERFLRQYFPLEANNELRKDALWRLDFATALQMQQLYQWKIVSNPLPALMNAEASFWFAHRWLKHRTKKAIEIIPSEEELRQQLAEEEEQEKRASAKSKKSVLDLEAIKRQHKEDEELELKGMIREMESIDDDDDDDEEDDDEFLDSMLPAGQLPFTRPGSSGRRTGKKKTQRLVVIPKPPPKVESKPPSAREKLIMQAESAYQWYIWGTKGFVLPFTVKTFNYLEISENVLGQYDLWIVSGRNRMLVPIVDPESPSAKKSNRLSSRTPTPSLPPIPASSPTKVHHRTGSSSKPLRSYDDEDDESDIDSKSWYDADHKVSGSVQAAPRPKAPEPVPSVPQLPPATKPFDTANIPEHLRKYVESFHLALSAAEELAALVISEEYLRLKRRDAPWKKHPASEKQIELLRKLNVFPTDSDGLITKGEASQLIDQALAKGRLHRQ